MDRNSRRDNQNRDAHAAALLAGVTIVVGFLLYWSVQIGAVREMLALAYGG